MTDNNTSDKGSVNTIEYTVSPIMLVQEGEKGL